MPSSAITTGDKLPGPKSGPLSQSLHTFFGGTAMLGQVQEEIIEVGIYATNELFLMEEVEAALEFKSNEAQDAAVELASLKVANEQVQIAADIPAPVE